MNTYLFHGRVIPERAQVNFGGHNELEIIQPDIGVKFKLKVNIVLSIISAYVTSKDEITDLASLKNYLNSVVSFLVDAIGFANGCGYMVEIDSCTYNDGKSFVVFGVDIHELEDENRWETTLDVITAHRVASNLQQPQLHRALEELRKGIKFSSDTGFHSFRAIEGIKKTFSGETDGDMWQAMGKALNINDSYVSEFRDTHAFNQRHGVYTFMSSEDRVEMLIKTKTIISRFISYIKSGSKKLNSSRYPNLS